MSRPPSERNVSIVEARAAGRTIQSIALEHDLSLARVSKILQDHQKDVEIARLKNRVAELEFELMMTRHELTGQKSLVETHRRAARIIERMR